MVWSNYNKRKFTLDKIILPVSKKISEELFVQEEDILTATIFGRYANSKKMPKMIVYGDKLYSATDLNIKLYVDSKWNEDKQEHFRQVRRNASQVFYDEGHSVGLNFNPVFLRSQSKSKIKIQNVINQIPFYLEPAYVFLEDSLIKKFNQGIADVKRRFIRRALLEGQRLVQKASSKDSFTYLSTEISKH